VNTFRLSKLQVGHPPGAPFFQMIGRFFSLFAFGDVTKVAIMVNYMSALCSAATILFLFWSITMLGLKFTKDEEISQGRVYAILGSGWLVHWLILSVIHSGFRLWKVKFTLCRHFLPPLYSGQF